MVSVFDHLILNSVKERVAAKNGECPNCGYDLRGQNKSQFGCQGMRGGRQRGGQMNGIQRPDAQSGTTPRQGGMQCGQQQTPNGQVPQM